MLSDYPKYVEIPVNNMVLYGVFIQGHRSVNLGNVITAVANLRKFSSLCA